MVPVLPRTVLAAVKNYRIYLYHKFDLIFDLSHLLLVLPPSVDRQIAKCNASQPFLLVSMKQCTHHNDYIFGFHSYLNLEPLTNPKPCILNPEPKTPNPES